MGRSNPTFLGLSPQPANIATMAVISSTWLSQQEDVSYKSKDAAHKNITRILNLYFCTQADKVYRKCVIEWTILGTHPAQLQIMVTSITLEYASCCNLGPLLIAYAAHRYKLWFAQSRISARLRSVYVTMNIILTSFCGSAMGRSWPCPRQLE